MAAMDGNVHRYMILGESSHSDNPYKIRTYYKHYFRNLLPLYRDEIFSIIKETCLVLRTFPIEIRFLILSKLLSDINNNLGLIHNRFRSLAIEQIFDLSWPTQYPFYLAVEKIFNIDFNLPNRDFINLQFENIPIYNIQSDLNL
jgi:hypothetical protein